jgi:hypothetical protein
MGHPSFVTRTEGKASKSQFSRFPSSYGCLRQQQRDVLSAQFADQTFLCANERVG